MSVLAAADGGGAKRELVVAEALERASQRAPELVLAEQQIREVGARRAGAGIIMPVNPRLQVEVRPPFTQGKFLGDLGYSATIDGNFDLGGAPCARVREVERDVELASAERNRERVSARLRVVAAYLGAQLAGLRAHEARAGMEIAQRVLDAAQKRIDAGAGSEFERASAQLELTRVASRRRSSAARARRRADGAARRASTSRAASPLELTTQHRGAAAIGCRGDVPASSAASIIPSSCSSAARACARCSPRASAWSARRFRDSVCTPAWMPRPSRPCSACWA